MSHTPKTTTYATGRAALKAVAYSATLVSAAAWVLPVIDAGLPSQVVGGALAAVTVCSVIAMTSVVSAIGRSWASMALIPGVLIIAALQAYSLHNANEVLIEAPRKAAHLASADTVVTNAEHQLDTARTELKALPVLVVPEGVGPQGVVARRIVWEAQREPLAQAVETAKAELVEAKSARVEAETNYRSFVPDAAVWIVGLLLDLCVAALGIWGLEMTAKRQHERDTSEHRQMLMIAADAEAMAAERAEREAQEAREKRRQREQARKLAEIEAEAKAKAEVEARNSDRRKAARKAKLAARKAEADLKSKIPAVAADNGASLRRLFEVVK